MNTDPAATTRTALHLISDAIRPLVEGSTFELATLVNVAMNGWSDADAPGIGGCSNRNPRIQPPRA